MPQYIPFSSARTRSLDTHHPDHPPVQCPWLRFDPSLFSSSLSYPALISSPQTSFSPCLPTLPTSPPSSPPHLSLTLPFLPLPIQEPLTPLIPYNVPIQKPTVSVVPAKKQQRPLAEPITRVTPKVDSGSQSEIDVSRGQTITPRALESSSRVTQHRKPNESVSRSGPTHFRPTSISFLLNDPPLRTEFEISEATFSSELECPLLLQPPIGQDLPPTEDFFHSNQPDYFDDGYEHPTLENSGEFDNAESSPHLLNPPSTSPFKTPLLKKRPQQTSVNSTPNFETPQEHSTASPDPELLLDESPGDEREYDQWRVGKMPGHQGSYLRAAKRDVFSEGFEDSAARVLKRPFKPPRVVLKPATPKTSGPSLASSPPRISASPPLPSSPTSAPGFTPKSNSVPSRIQRRPRVSKPFKPPASTQCPKDGPASQGGARPRVSSSPDEKRKSEPESRLVSNLEDEARLLRQAVRYATDPTEDDRLDALIEQWREAGRIVVERLFKIVPSPQDAQNDSKLSTAVFGYEGSHEFGSEQRENRSYTGRDFQDSVRLMFSSSNFDFGFGDESAEHRFDSYTTAPFSNSNAFHSSNFESAVWDMGALMTRFGVDPALLGWNQDAEDWD